MRRYVALPICLTALASLVWPVNATGILPQSKEGAMIAGEYVAVAEACFGDPEAYLTSDAKKFAKIAEKQNSRWYFISYNNNIKGAAFFDEPFCNEVIFKRFEAKGSASKRLGFRIMNTDNFTE